MAQTRMAEAPRMQQFIIDTLSADSIITANAPAGVWPDAIPEDETGLGVVVSYTALPDVMGLGKSRTMAAGLWRVEAIGNARTDDDALTIVADRIDADLHGASGTTTDARILGAIRTGEVHRSELIGTIQWLHRGGDYRMYAQPLTGA